MRRSNLILALCVLAIVPLFVYRWVSAKDKRYDDLVHRFECSEMRACSADFDGDGVAGKVVIEWRLDSKVNGDQWLIAFDGGKELLRLPFWYADNTLRSHAAIRNESGKSRLLIFWGAMREPKNSTSVFIWSGERMAEMDPNGGDLELLAAMAARDDSGGFTSWVAFRLIRDAALVVYYVLLAGAAVFILIRFQRKRRSLRAEI